MMSAGSLPTGLVGRIADTAGRMHVPRRAIQTLFSG
jgi:hypothetical protein